MKEDDISQNKRIKKFFIYFFLFAILYYACIQIEYDDAWNSKDNNILVHGFCLLIIFGAPISLILLILKEMIWNPTKEIRYKCNSCQWTGTELKNYRKCPHCTSDNISSS